jgi:HAD superfamily hydrolase (TIGR01509 family)
VAQAAALRRELADRVLAAASPATVAVLDSLRDAGWRLALVSNATAETAEAWPRCPLAGRFDVAVFSCDVAVAKPDPGIYLAAVEGLGTRPADCVYIGDGADEELAGAAALGMLAIRTTEYNDTDLLARPTYRLDQRPPTSTADNPRRAKRGVPKAGPCPGRRQRSLTRNTNPQRRSRHVRKPSGILRVGALRDKQARHADSRCAAKTSLLRTRLTVRR